MLETKELPDIISMFPGINSRVYFQNPETKEYWFHATDVCKVLGYTNVTSALGLHCDDDEKLQEIWQGKATWFVSEAGCYGLAFGSKVEIAKKFKRWLKHDVLKKLRAEGGYIMETATPQQLEVLQNRISEMQQLHYRYLVYHCFGQVVKGTQYPAVPISKIMDRIATYFYAHSNSMLDLNFTIERKKVILVKYNQKMKKMPAATLKTSFCSSDSFKTFLDSVAEGYYIPTLGGKGEQEQLTNWVSMI